MPTKIFFIPEPVVFAYRGGIPGLPPDTLDAYRKCIELGAHVIYVDVWLTGDNRVVIASGGALNVISNGKGKVSDHSLKELKELDSAYHFMRDGVSAFRGKGITFQTLEEVLEIFPAQRFNINIMENKEPLAEAVLDIVRRSNSENRVLISSYFQGPVNRVRKKNPEIATSMTMREIIAVYALFKTGLLFLKKRMKGDAMQIQEVFGTSYLANRGLIHALKMRGVRIHVLGVADEKQLRRCADSGADGFIMPDIGIYINPGSL